MFFYTVGLKRRFFFGWRKFKVQGHSWENGRLVMDLASGHQVHVPGVKIRAFQVYPDIKHVLQTLEQNKQAQEKERQWAEYQEEQEYHQRMLQQQMGRQPAATQQQMEAAPSLPPFQQGAEETPMDRARALANERVRGIPQGNAENASGIG